MELLVAYDGDPAGANMAEHLSLGMGRDDDDDDDDGSNAKDKGGQMDLWHSKEYDMAVIRTPAISADWLDKDERIRAREYDGFVFLSRHSAQSGVLALTCHSTGNFAGAEFGGRDREVAVPHPHLQRAYMRRLHANRSAFAGFEITLEATHHGPTALEKPSMFVEVGTTQKQWEDKKLCGSVAALVHDALVGDVPHVPTAICFGGTHYPSKFTAELLTGTRAVGTIIPKRAIGNLDENLFAHILERNSVAEEALIDWHGISGPDKRHLEGLLSTSRLQVTRI